ncbi:hypothetical protein DdX_14370 [Ditylenchus destructor]|uniref:Uncharacterized protein n=1 Tax=Ditylenchus destructor TaxID=166010 RepID=A0AAD4MS92_9BILA|nr:hypothetical protein DdX_14370 [Ditylenchus destructor]
MPTPSKEGNPIDANSQKHSKSTRKRSVDNKLSSSGTNNKCDSFCLTESNHLTPHSALEVVRNRKSREMPSG